MLTRDRVEIDLDPGANPDDPDERLTVFASVAAVTGRDAQDERRAA